MHLFVERDTIELVERGFVEEFTDAVRLRALGLGARVIDVLDREIRLPCRAKLAEGYGRTVVVAIIALLIFGATFRAGIDRGMDRLVSWEGYGRILNAIAAVMTEQRFHQGGYALSNCIHNEL